MHKHTRTRAFENTAAALDVLERRLDESRWLGKAYCQASLLLGGAKWYLDFARRPETAKTGQVPWALRMVWGKIRTIRNIPAGW